jgi:hypothetical protein
MFDRAIDEILIRLGHTVLILADPDITRTEEQKAALEKSVNQFAVCASSSQDERVTALACRLEAALNFHVPGRLH